MLLVKSKFIHQNTAMRKLSFTIVFLIFTRSISAQQYNIDSLRQLLGNNRNDTNRVVILNDLAFQYRHYRPDSTYYYAHQGMLLAQELQYKKGEAISLINMGISLSQTGNYPKAFDLLLGALKISEQIKSQDYIRQAFDMIAEIYDSEKDYKKVIEYERKALAMAQSEYSRTEMIENLGSEFAEIGQLDSALHYLNIASEGYIKLNYAQGIAF